MMKIQIPKISYLNTEAGIITAGEALDQQSRVLDFGRFGEIDLTAVKPCKTLMFDNCQAFKLEAGGGIRTFITPKDLSLLRPHRAWKIHRSMDDEDRFREFVAENYEFSETHEEHRIYIQELNPTQIAKLEYTLPFYGIEVETYIGEGYMVLDRSNPKCWVSTWITNHFDTFVRKLPEFIIGGWFTSNLNYPDLINYISQTGLIPPGHITLSDIYRKKVKLLETIDEDPDNFVEIELKYGVQVDDVYLPNIEYMFGSQTSNQEKSNETQEKEMKDVGNA